MPRLSFQQRIAALGLAAALSVSWASAAPQIHRAGRGAAPESLVQQILSLWADLWSPFRLMETLDAGCHVDPNGRCATGASQVAPPQTPDAGCHLDPSGGCAGGSW
jgi:hypothetical protein